MLPAPVGLYYHPVHITDYTCTCPRATSSIRPFIAEYRYAIMLSGLR